MGGFYFGGGGLNIFFGAETSTKEKLGLAPKVLKNLWGSAEFFFNGLFTMRNHHRIPQNLKGSAEFWGEGRGEPGPLLFPERACFDQAVVVKTFISFPGFCGSRGFLEVLEFVVFQRGCFQMFISWFS